MTEPNDGESPSPAPPLTRDEARSEMERAMTDPSHKMYAAAKRGLPMFGEWSDALYKRIPGGDKKVDFDRPLGDVSSVLT